MVFSLGDITDAVGDIAGGAFDLVESVGDLAGEVAPLLSLANPVAAIGLSSFASGTDLIGRIADEFMKQQENQRPGRREHCGKGEKGGCEGGSGEGKAGGATEGGGSIFEQIALAMGEAMDNKLKQLLEAADKVAALSSDLSDKADSSGNLKDKDKIKGEGEIMQASAQVTARGQELNVISSAFNTAANSVGSAAQNAASKR